ncbi:hypothetical protein AB3S75_029981 [Citrus x aurantiifolia]
MSSIHHLPVEILHRILSLLPVRELIRCRCVCKAWCSFIIKPDFISTHLNLHNNTLMGIFCITSWGLQARISSPYCKTKVMLSIQVSESRLGLRPTTSK